MKIFKRIDIYLQVLAVIAVLVYGIVSPGNLKYFYPVTGAVQLASILVHLCFPRSFYESPSRRIYYNALLVLLGLGFLMLIPPAFLGYLMLLVILTPFYACWYFIICYRENILLQKKAFIHLK